MALSLFLIKREDELLSLFPQISSLFENCFARPLDESLWKWAYLNNPYGQSCVAIASDADHVVGHYAAIPVRLSNHEGATINAGLSMTTMVSQKYIKENLFQYLAEIVYKNLADSSFDLVYGYPNKKSRPGFRKRLGWQVDLPMQIAKTTKRDYIASSCYKNYFSDANSFTLDVYTERAREWRFGKPGHPARFINGAYYKEFNGALDLLQVINRDSFESSDLDLEFNALLPAEHSSQGPNEYFSGYRLLSRSMPLKLFHQMSCSDVF
jgi:hypothetical protein